MAMPFAVPTPTVWTTTPACLAAAAASATPDPVSSPSLTTINVRRARPSPNAAMLRAIAGARIEPPGIASWVAPASSSARRSAPRSDVSGQVRSGSPANSTRPTARGAARSTRRASQARAAACRLGATSVASMLREMSRASRTDSGAARAVSVAPPPVRPTTEAVALPAAMARSTTRTTPRNVDEGTATAGPCHACRAERRPHSRQAASAPTSRAAARPTDGPRPDSAAASRTAWAITGNPSATAARGRARAPARWKPPRPARPRSAPSGGW